MTGQPSVLADIVEIGAALRELRQRVERIEHAVTDLTTAAPGAGRVSGGAPSWEPIRCSALAWLQSVEADASMWAGHLDGQRTFRGAPQPAAAFEALGWLQDVAATVGADESRHLRGTVRGWLDHARQILAEIGAPRELGACPKQVRDRVREDDRMVDDVHDCGGLLTVRWVQRTVRVERRPVWFHLWQVSCSLDDTHVWWQGTEILADGTRRPRTGLLDVAVAMGASDVQSLAVDRPRTHVTEVDSQRAVLCADGRLHYGPGDCRGVSDATVLRLADSWAASPTCGGAPHTVHDWVDEEAS